MRLRAIVFGTALVFVLLLTACSKTPRVGVLTGGSAAHIGIVAFPQALRDLGYTEGRNIELVYRYGDGNDDRLPGFAEELVKMNVAVILADGRPAALAVQQLTNTIPIVTTDGDPVQMGSVDNAARPGGNTTGLAILPAGMHLKRFELLRQAVPGVRRVAYLWHAYDQIAIQLQEVQAAARTLGLELILVEVKDPSRLDNAFGDIASAHVDALVAMPSLVFVSHLDRIVHLTTETRLPSVFVERQFAQAGALMSYGPDVPAVFRGAAAYVDRILRGAKPADLPVVYPREFDLVINLRTAKALGLTIPPTLLQRANEVIR